MKGDELDQLLRQVPVIQGEDTHVDEAALLAYRAGQIEDGHRDALEFHLARCLRCRNALRVLADPLPAELEDWARQHPRAHRPKWLKATSFGGLIAAALVLGFWVSQPDTEADFVVEGPSGQVRRTRGDPQSDDQRLVFGPESRLELIVRPTVVLTAPPEVAIYAGPLGGPYSRWAARFVKATPSGGYLAEAPASEVLGPTSGVRGLLVLADRPFSGWPDRIPDDSSIPRIRSRVLYRGDVEYRRSIENE